MITVNSLIAAHPSNHCLAGRRDHHTGLHVRDPDDHDHAGRICASVRLQRNDLHHPQSEHNQRDFDKRPGLCHGVHFNYRACDDCDRGRLHHHDEALHHSWVHYLPIDRDGAADDNVFQLSCADCHHDCVCAGMPELCVPALRERGTPHAAKLQSAHVQSFAWSVEVREIACGQREIMLLHVMRESRRVYQLLPTLLLQFTRRCCCPPLHFASATDECTSAGPHRSGRLEWESPRGSSQSRRVPRCSAAPPQSFQQLGRG
jgi:hypothetical protein